MGLNPAARLRGVRKSYGTTVAVEHLDLSIAPGSFFTMLGPSGSGKTTVLRLIAGFELPDAGTIELAGQNITHLPPNRRHVNTVFQDYALFPHMSLLDNVCYGLLAKRVPAAEARLRAEAALAQVQLADLASRRPAQLSGGQRQRVALARAIVNRPALLLLDEPLGALDLQLRHRMQQELKALQHETGIAFVYVTHDQEEALAMSDRVAVFNRGRIEQEGTPVEIYEQPASEFVAGFVGTASLLRRNGKVTLLRPEHVRLQPHSIHGEGEPAMVRETRYLGTCTRIAVELADGNTLLASWTDGPPPPPGTAVMASWQNPARSLLKDAAA